MISISVLNILVVLFGILLSLNFYKRNKKVPPGPAGIPLLGNIFQIGRDPSKTLQRWSKEYGPIFSVNILGSKIVFLNDSKWIKEMMSQSAFIGKPQTHLFSLLSKGSYGILISEGEVWEAHRRFTLRGLRDYGFSKSSMEELIMHEVSHILDWFRQNDGKTLSMTQGFNVAFSNSLWMIISGERNNQENSEVGHLFQELLREITVVFQRGLYVIPWLRYIIPEWSGYNSFAKTTNKLHEFVGRAIEDHKKYFVEKNPRDFIDLYLQEIRDAKPGSPFYKEIGEKHMQSTIVDLFLAGNETTSVTLAWATLYIAHHPGVQNAMQNEIDTVVGKARQPFLSDRTRMPYCEAVILEVLRKSTLTPFGVPHRAVQDKEFEGYLIEKDTFIVAHLQYVLTNPDVWGDPQNFRPERFLNEDKTKVSKNDHLIPFQAGKRQCLGEGLARDTLFLFISNIIQQFEILPDPQNPKPDFSPQMSFINEPKKFKVLLRLRHN